MIKSKYMGHCLNMYMQLLSGVKSLIFISEPPSSSKFVYARSQGSGKTVHMQRHVRAFAHCQCHMRVVPGSRRLFK